MEEIKRVAYVGPEHHCFLSHGTSSICKKCQIYRGFGGEILEVPKQIRDKYKYTTRHCAICKQTFDDKQAS